MPSRESDRSGPQEPMRPPLTPSLAYEAASPSETSPPTISAFVAEAVVYLSNAAVSEGSTTPANAQTTERDTTPVINAVVRLLDTMTATRFSRIQNLIADQELTNSSIGTDDLGNSLLDDFDLAFQMPDPEAADWTSKAVLSDGSLVTLGDMVAPETQGIDNERQHTQDSQLASQSGAYPSNGDGFWKRLFNFGHPQEAPEEQAHSMSSDSCNSFFKSAPKHINCADIELAPVDCKVGTGPMKILPNLITNVQGYTWNSLADYQNDKMQRLKHFRRQLMGTRQFLERKSGPMLRQVVNNVYNAHLPGGLDIRRQKRKIWLKLYGNIPQPRLLARLKFFHRLAEPVYDHFQLKNLLCLRADKEVFYLSHQRHGDRKYTCVMTYNLQTQSVERVLGPWSFNCARPLSHNSRPIYHSLASISFESRYLFSLAISENYVATSDTSSSILLSRRKSRRTKKSTIPDFGIQLRPSTNGGGLSNELPVAGHKLLCQRVSSQPLQIINSIQLIELADRTTNYSFNESPREHTSRDLLDIIWKQAQDKSKRIFRAACQSLESMFDEVKTRVALGQAWQILKRDPGNDPRSLRRLRSLFTPSATAFMRNTISIFTPDDLNSQESSPENQQDHVPCPTNLVVLTAGNDKTLCEYSLASQMCRESTHILLENGDSICKLRPNGVSGFSACSGLHPNARCKKILRLKRSWQYPFCINRIAVHPDKNLLLLVGDSPSVILTARSAPTSHYSGIHGSIKNSLFTIEFHQDASFAAAWHPNGLMFATGCDDRTVAIWDLRQLMAPLHVLRTEVTACRNLEFSPDGKYLLSCESEDAVVLYSVEEDFAVAQKVPFFGGCTGAAFSSDSQRIIVGVGPPGGIMELVINRLPAAAAKCNKDILVS